MSQYPRFRGSNIVAEYSDYNVLQKNHFVKPQYRYLSRSTSSGHELYPSLDIIHASILVIIESKPLPFPPQLGRLFALKCQRL